MLSVISTASGPFIRPRKAVLYGLWGQREIEEASSTTNTSAAERGLQGEEEESGYGGAVAAPWVYILILGTRLRKLCDGIQVEHRAWIGVGWDSVAS